MSPLDGMIAEVGEVNLSNGWRDTPLTFGDLIALLHSELSEALEAYRSHGLNDFGRQVCERKRLHNPEEDPGHICKPEGVPSELADVLIRLLDMCGIYGINLMAEYERKIAYNRTRPYRHGGRAL